MKKFDEIEQLIEQNKSNHDMGYYNCIPFDIFPRLEKYIPGITQGTQYIITGATASAKSKISRYLFIHNPYYYVKNNPQLGIDLDIHYFSLEESKEKIYLSEVARSLKTKHNISVSINDLRSVGKHNTIPKELFPKIKECEKEVQMFMDKVIIYDKFEANPTGVYKIMRDVAHKIGRFKSKDGRLFTEHEMNQVKMGIGDTYKHIGGYELINPKHYVIILYDNVNIMPTEAGMSLHEAITKLSSDYFLTLKNNFKMIPVIVHQQAMSKEQMEFTSKGVSIDEKLEPSLDGLGDNKLIARDAEVIFGTFNPARYNIQVHNGYMITKLKDNYRSLNLLKYRDGVEGRKLPLFFDGACDFFAEMPKLDDTKTINKIYNYAKKLAEERAKRTENE